jgi:hypothetical protein
MRFTIEPEPLIKTASMVIEWMPDRKKGDLVLLMVACAGRVRLESRTRAAEIDAPVWEDGQCTLSQAKLLETLKVYRDKTKVTFQADDHGLWIGEHWMAVMSYHARAAAPKAFQIFLATDSGVVSSRFAPPLVLAPTS